MTSQRRLISRLVKRNIKPSNVPTISIENVAEEIIGTDYNKIESFHHYFNNDNNIHRQHDHHFLKKHLFQCEISCPIQDELIKGKDCKIIDLGCGPSTFLLDLSAQHPNSRFFGVDIETTFPSEIKPKNLEFKLVDIIQGLPFPDNAFDLVHIESTLFTIPSVHVNFIISEMIRICKPNGYIEFCESIYNQKSRGIGEKFGKLLHGFELVSNLYETDMHIALNLPKMLSMIPNIKNINLEDQTIIVGKNGGKVGVIMHDILTWFKNSSEFFVNDICKQLNLTKEQYDQLIVDAFNELNVTFSEMIFRRIYVQKSGC
ncbi:7530_t:CDS:2 [Funneliformis geosporum]|uniref:7530_t:CDS:1 n=1 Tax=Funneliformis geosporum TaxID=1117311 RepID=A0A9W4SA26_9GLOM|nr:7530_t:CDS:2 [Funneliformis geosporum]